MKDNLLIAENMKKTIIYLDKIVINFPNDEKILKDRIRDTLFDALELTYYANNLNKNERIIYQKKIMAKIKMVDFYFKISFDKKYISYKKYKKIGLFLLNISKSLYGWIKYEKVQ